MQCSSESSCIFPFVCCEVYSNIFDCYNLLLALLGACKNQYILK